MCAPPEGGSRESNRLGDLSPAKACFVPTTSCRDAANSEMTEGPGIKQETGGVVGNLPRRPEGETLGRKDRGDAPRQTDEGGCPRRMETGSG